MKPAAKSSSGPFTDGWVTRTERFGVSAADVPAAEPSRARKTGVARPPILSSESISVRAPG